MNNQNTRMTKDEAEIAGAMLLRIGDTSFRNDNALDKRIDTYYRFLQCIDLRLDIERWETPGPEAKVEPMPNKREQMELPPPHYPGAWASAYVLCYDEQRDCAFVGWHDHDTHRWHSTLGKELVNVTKWEALPAGFLPGAQPMTEKV